MITLGITLAEISFLWVDSEKMKQGPEEFGSIGHSWSHSG